MWDIIRYVFTVMSTVPFIPFLIVFFAYGLFEKERKQVIRVSMDVSTIFFILNVAAMFNTLFHSTFGLYGILLFMLIGGGLLGNALYRKHGNVQWSKILRIVWRITFFITVLLYVIFTVFILFKLAFTVS